MRLGCILIAIVSTLLVSSEARSLRQSPTSESETTTSEDPADEERIFKIKTVVTDAAEEVVKKVKDAPLPKKEKIKNFIAKALLPKVNDNLRLEYNNGRWVRDTYY
ncbi:RxLR effector protein [Phytophthora megakarya]|uniref:RxLR effector protein n=1 Tax=Phytophthora megakarya TaxID=4795 RepID=A0A225VEN8_9STRA|nr:RxLR effector protein [Phytophthora megakarya]